MNRNIDRSQLSRLIAGQAGTDQRIVDAFIQQLFRNIENSLVDDRSVRLNKFGLFRIIRSGNTNRILFLSSPQTTGDSMPGYDYGEPGNNNDGLRPEKSSMTTHIPEDEDAEDNSFYFNKEQTPEIRFEERKFSPPPYPGPSKRIFNSDFSNERNERNDRGKKKTFAFQAIVVALTVLALILGTYIYLVAPKSGTQNLPVVNNTPPSSPVPVINVTKPNFTELENTDPQNLSCIVVTDRTVSLRELSVIYYGNELFWPYLYKANENIVVDLNSIPGRSIVKIPKITVDLVDLNTGKLDSTLEALGNEIVLKAQQTGSRR